MTGLSPQNRALVAQETAQAALRCLDRGEGTFFGAATLNALLDAARAAGAADYRRAKLAEEGFERVPAAELDEPTGSATIPAPPAAWAPGVDGNAERPGWVAYFEGRNRDDCPFPLDRLDLQRRYREGWDAAMNHDHAELRAKAAVS